jgi:hypothetical protein
MATNRTNAATSVRFTFAYTTEAANISKMIDKIASAGATLQANIQIAALSCLGHLAIHRDRTLIPRLFKALPAGLRRTYLANWFNQHSYMDDPLTPGFIVDSKTGDVELAEFGSADWKSFIAESDKIIARAKTVNWWACKDGQDKPEVTFDTIVESLKKRAKNKKIASDLQRRLELLVTEAERIAVMDLN